MMSGGDTSGDTKTTTQNLTPEQQRLAGLAMPNYEAFAASNPTLPGSGGVAQFDPLQTAGQNQVLANTDTQQGVVGSAANANQRMTSGELLDPSSNPALRATMDAANRPVMDNLMRKILPGIAADSSTGAGGISANVGGSRQAIVEGNSINDAGTQMADNNAKIATAGYNSGLNAMGQGVGQAGAVAADQTIPGTTTSTVGDIRQGQNQANLTANAQAKQFADMLPLLKAQLLSGGASSLPGGSTTSVGSGNKNPSLLSSIVGGASAAGGLLGGAGNAASGLSKLLPLLAVAA